MFQNGPNNMYVYIYICIIIQNMYIYICIYIYRYHILLEFPKAPHPELKFRQMSGTNGSQAVTLLRKGEATNTATTRDSSQEIPSRELTYPTLGKGKSSSKCHFGGIC